MYHLLIVEDDENQLETIQKIITTAYPSMKIEACTTYKKALSLIQQQDRIFHFFFLDIDLQENSEKSGITLGECIRAQQRYEYTPIIYITSVTDKIQEALNKLHCTNFISKPYKPQDITDTLTRLLHAPTAEHPAITIQEADGIFYQIQQKDIIYVAAEHKNIVIHTIYDSFTTRKYSLTSLLSVLTFPKLLQCHRSYIINLDFMMNYDKSTLSLHLHSPHDDNIFITVGRSFQKELEKQLNCP